MNKRFILRGFLLGVAIVAYIAVVAQQLPAVSPEQVGMSSVRLERLSKVFNTYIEEEQLPCASILVARKGKVAYFETFGERDREKGLPIEPNTIYRIASQTKAIVSTGIMILQEEGKLLIKDPLHTYLPAFKETTVAVAREEGGYDIVPAERPITLRDLLTHTAGIGYGGGPAKDQWEKADIQGWYFAHREEPIQATINQMASLPFDAQPGERFVYGYNTDILGAVIEVVSGQPLDQFLKERILNPLGMKDTHFYLPPAKKDRLAVVYAATENGLEKAPDPGGMIGQGAYVEGPRKSFSGGAGLLSTAEDYAAFLQMMLNKGVYKGHRILSPKTVELMTVSHLGDTPFTWARSAGMGFGLGFAVVENVGERGVPGSVGEFSWGGAYHSTYWVDPQEELVVVYFTQVIPAKGREDHEKLRTLVYQAIMD